MDIKADQHNPYTSPQQSERKHRERVSIATAVCLTVCAVAGVPPPLLLFSWVFDGEPFVAWNEADIGCCVFAGYIGAGWVAWGFVFCRLVATGRLPLPWLLLLLLPMFFGGVAFLSGYLYLCDRIPG